MPTGMTDLRTSGQRIAFLRKAKGWSQETLAKRVCVSQPAVAHWEACRYTPGRQSQALLAGALDVSMSFLFGEEVA